MDVVITEIGGTVGDIEGLPFLEAVRQFKKDVGKDNVMYVHLTLVPYIHAAQELKTKATQHSVKELRAIGIQPDMLLCRTAKDHPLTPSIKSKIALFCDVEEEAVIAARDVDTIYEVPIAFHDQGLDESIIKLLGAALPADRSLPLGGDRAPDQGAAPPLPHRGGGQVHRGEGLLQEPLRGARPRGHRPRGGGRGGVGGRRAHRARGAGRHVAGLDGILVPGGFGDRGIEGKIQAIRYAREQRVPYFGICLGMQCAVIEYARNVCGLEGANSTEFNPATAHNVIDLLPEQRHIQDKGGTMRLGLYPVLLSEGTAASRVYGQGLIEERHRHRYEVNNDYLARLEKNGLRISGLWAEKQLVEIIELSDHPWFVAGQFHPEFRSRPWEPHPLFAAFIKAAIDHQGGA